MVCCGKGKGSKCNLCGESSTKFYPWGTTRHICWRCHDKMVAKIADMKQESNRILTLLNKKDWSRKKYEESKK